jgi:hypothetical protein
VGHAVQLGRLDSPPLSVPTVMRPKPMGYGPYPITDQTADLIGVRSWIWRTANIAYAAWPGFVVFRKDSLDMVKQGYALVQSQGRAAMEEEKELAAEPKRTARQLTRRGG